jgi:hypothetical protein
MRAPIALCLLGGRHYHRPRMRAPIALCLLVCASAHAQEPVPEPSLDPPRPRVAVLLLATGELDPTVADELNELLIGGVAARGGVTILGREELEAQIAQSSSALIECIGSMACMGRLGVELGVAEVIAGTLAQRDGTWVFNLNRVDVRSGEIVGRAFREVEGDLGAVADALSESLPLLYTPTVRRGTIVIDCDTAGMVSIDGVEVGAIEGETLRREVDAGRHEVRVTARERLPWRRTIEVAGGAEVHLEAQLPPATTTEVNPLVWVGLGVMVGAFAIALPLGVASQSELDLSLARRRTMEVTRAEAQMYYQDREAEAIAADVLFAISGAGAILLAVTVFLPVVRAIDPPPVEMSIGPGAIAIRGAFP